MRGGPYPTRLVRAFELSRESNFNEIASRGIEPRLVWIYLDRWARPKIAGALVSTDNRPSVDQAVSSGLSAIRKCAEQRVVQEG